MSHDFEGDPTLREHPEQSPVQPEPVGTVAQRRLRQLGFVVVIVAAAVAVILITTGASGSSPPRPGTVRAIEREVDSLLAGIPQHTTALGQPEAPVTLRWFGDLECPFCKEFTLGALTPIIRQWVRGGQLRIEYLSMQTATREPEVFRKQQVAALAAGMQNKLWYFIEAFYREQGQEDSGYVTDHYLQDLAQQVPGLSLSLWAEDRFDPELIDQIDADRQIVKKERFRGTPAFLIGLTGGRMFTIAPKSLTSPELFNEAIEYLLQR
jgi:protein-disulfide isomerase